MLSNYLKFAWRNLANNKGFSMINILGLSIGITVAVLIGLWLKDELTFNRIHLNYDRLAGVWVTQTFDARTGSGNAVPIPLEDELRTSFPQDFKNMSRASWSWDHTLAKGSDKIIQEEGMFVEPSFPEMFSLQMIQGDISSMLNDVNSVVISESVARALFGSDNPLGQTLRLDQDKDVVVSGVFRDLPKNSEFFLTKMFMPWAMHQQEEWVKYSMDKWDNHSWQMFVEVNAPAQMQAISSKIEGVERAHNKDGKPSLFLHPMSRWHLYDEFKDGVNIGGRIQYAWLFGIIGLFVVLLACINFMNLATARSEKRAREVGIRKSIGSGRGQLISQFLGESLLVSVLALAIALVLVWLFLPGFNKLADKKIIYPLTDPVFWSAVGAFTVFTALLAGSYPAFFLSSFQPIKVLKGTFKTGRSASLPRKALVVLQFTVSITMIIGTIVVFKQIEYAKSRPVGYARAGLIQTGIPKEMEDRYDVMRQNLLESGVVEEMSWSNSPATEIYSNQIGFSWEGKDPNSQPMFGTVDCTHDFGASIGWQIKEGRDFSRAFATDSVALIFNESAVKLTGLTDIVGKTIRQDDVAFHVVGVVKDMVMESPYKPIKPTIFRVNYNWVSTMNIRLKPGIPAHEAVAGIEAVIKKVSPGALFDYKFTDEEYDAKFRSEERIGRLARWFAILAIFISCLGLFGLSAYVAERRTKEIGIRKVLGASSGQLWAMLSREFVLLVLISCGLAIPVAWHYLNNWLGDYDYRIRLQWQFFMVSGLLALSITLLTISFQSIKAALSNPVQSLRNE